MKRRLFVFQCLMLPVLLAPVFPALASDFETRCAALSSTAKMNVHLIDRQPFIQQNKSIAELKAIKGLQGDHHHHILGLTLGKPLIEYSANLALIPDPQSQAVCLMPSIEMRIGLHELQIDLARELTSACRKNVILDHEMEHANTWRNHLRIASRLLPERIRSAIGPARIFPNRAEAMAAKDTWLAGAIGPIQQQLLQGIVASQTSIDSAHSYAMVEGRLRNCPPP